MCGYKKIIKIRWDKYCMLHLPIRAKEWDEALRDESWTTALQKELNQFIKNDVWYLVPRLKDKHVIGTK